MNKIYAKNPPREIPVKKDPGETKPEKGPNSNYRETEDRSKPTSNDKNKDSIFYKFI